MGPLVLAVATLTAIIAPGTDAAAADAAASKRCTLHLHPRRPTSIVRGEISRSAGTSTFTNLSCAAATAAGTSGLSSPGCTNFGDTFVYTNPDYTLVRQLLSFPQIGLNNTLSNLTSPATLFAPNNEAFTTYNTAANITHTEALSSPLLAGFAQLLVVPEALLVGSLQQRAIRAPQI